MTKNQSQATKKNPNKRVQSVTHTRKISKCKFDIQNKKAVLIYSKRLSCITFNF